MKKSILIVLILFSLTLSGQDSIKYVYCEIVGRGDVFRKKMSVELDFGKREITTDYIDPATGKPYRFISMVDAMNFMSEKGWEVVSTYAVSEGGDRAVAENVYHYLLRKTGHKDLIDSK